jgi:hypothetical protein
MSTRLLSSQKHQTHNHFELTAYAHTLLSSSVWNYTSTCIHQLNESDIIWLTHLPVAFVEIIIQVPNLFLPTFHISQLSMPFQQTRFCENISRGTLSQASSILLAHSAYMSIKLIATKTIYSQALSMIHSWADLLWMPVYKHKHSALYESEIGWCRFLQNGHSPLHILAQTFSTLWKWNRLM